MILDLKSRRKQLGVSLDELAATLGGGYSRARLSIAERGLIQISPSEKEVISCAMERLGDLRSQIRSVVDVAESLDLVSLCTDIRRQAESVRLEA